MPNIAVIHTSPLSPSADIRGSCTYTSTGSATNLDTIGISRQAAAADALTTDSPLVDDRPDEQQPGLADRLKDMMTENQLVINTFIAGGLAGATSRTVVSPLERLKIILYVLTNDPLMSSYWS